MAPAAGDGLVEFKKYEDIISRVADLLNLLSVAPVLFSGRFSAGGRHGGPQRRLVAEADSRDQLEQESEGPVEASWPKVPLGIPSVLFLMISEAIRHQDVFARGAKAAAKGAKGLSGPLAELLQAVAKSKKLVKPKLGIVQNITVVIVEAFDSSAAFAAAHCLLLLTALGVALATLALMAVNPMHVGIRQATFRLTQAVSLMAPIMLFAFFRLDSLRKAGRGLSNEGLLDMLPLALRVLALIAAARPAPTAADEAGDSHCERPVGAKGSSPAAPARNKESSAGTPVWFAAFQLASLTASLSADIASGSLGKALGPFMRQPLSAESFSKYIIDSDLCTIIAPKLVGIMWLAVVHLQHDVGALMIAALLSCASSPMVLSKAWPVLLLALGRSTAKVSAEAVLKQCVTLTYAASLLPVLVGGGTVTLLVATLMMQVLIYCHGQDELLSSLQALA